MRSTDVHGRVILDVDWVPSPGGEAATAMDCFRTLAPQCPGAQGVVYDTALRGVHHQTAHTAVDAINLTCGPTPIPNPAPQPHDPTPTSGEPLK